MKHEIATEIIECLPRGKTPFNYFKDRYAFKLLELAIEQSVPVNSLKNSRFSKLLQKPAVKDFMANYSNGMIANKSLKHYWHEKTEAFLLTLGIWNGNNSWSQTTRKGVNLVLQMNFSNKHREQYLKLIKPVNDDPFIDNYHPVLLKNAREIYRDTMAWARIDLDLSTNEALIEEIQNDWLRNAKESYLDAISYLKKNRSYHFIYGCKGNAEEMKHYYEECLNQYEKIWDEAMLTAAITFIREEIGIKDIYYHSHKTGNKLKKINYSAPPESIYKTLPKKFCFDSVKKGPEFIEQDKQFKRKRKAIKDIQWFKLDLTIH